MTDTNSPGTSVRVSDYDGPDEHFNLWLRFKGGETLSAEELETLYECGAI